MRTTLRVVAAVFALAAVIDGTKAYGQKGLSEEQLLDLVAEGVSEAVILDLVKRDCVGFPLDATTVLDLSKRVPESILREAISCSSARDSMVSQNTPPGVDPTASDIELSAKESLRLPDVKTIAIVPFTLDAQVDPSLTSVFRERLEKRKTRFKLLDPISLQVHFEDTGAFHSNAPVKSLLAAARSVGADALFLGTASTYEVLGSPAVRLDVRIVEVNRGTVLWSEGGASKGGGWSWQHAKKVASQNVVKKLPR